MPSPKPLLLPARSAPLPHAPHPLYTLAMTDTIDIAHLSKLAQLELPETELAAAEADLRNIMLMVDAMGDVNTDGVEPLSHPVEFSARLRDDAVTETVDPDRFQGNAPDTADQMYLVPRVVE